MRGFVQDFVDLLVAFVLFASLDSVGLCKIRRYSLGVCVDFTGFDQLDNSFSHTLEDIFDFVPVLSGGLVVDESMS